MSNELFDVAANQVFAFVLQDGSAKKSWDLRRVFYGDLYLASSSKKNNAAYNRNRKRAVDAQIMVQEGNFYTLGPVGKELVAWAKETGKDLSLVKSVARADFEAANPAEVPCSHEGCTLSTSVDHSHATITG